MNTKPNLYWRNVIRREMYRAPPDDADFLAFTEQWYLESKQTLADANAPHNDVATARLGIFLVTILLLTYGRLDVIGDLLENVPPWPHPAGRGLIGAVHALIPLPAGMSARQAPLDALAWIRANEARLHWNDAEGRFVLA